MLNSESEVSYDAGTESEDEIIERAMQILQRRFDSLEQLNSSAKSAEYLVMRYREHKHEVFGVIYLDQQHQVLALEELFTGTIDGCAVYPRRVVEGLIKHGAAKVLIFHNHPSGYPKPSKADISITEKLVAALGTISAQVLDHLVLGAGRSYSFAEHGDAGL